jgi:hypothetical protein
VAGAICGRWSSLRLAGARPRPRMHEWIAAPLDHRQGGTRCCGDVVVRSCRWYAHSLPASAWWGGHFTAAPRHPRPNGAPRQPRPQLRTTDETTCACCSSLPPPLHSPPQERSSLTLQPDPHARCSRRTQCAIHSASLNIPVPRLPPPLVGAARHKRLHARRCASGRTTTAASAPASTATAAKLGP